MDELFEYSDSLNSPFEAFSGDWKMVKPHWHYFTEMVYLVKGKLYAEVDSKQFTLTAGDMIIFHPRQIHSFADYMEKNEEELFDRVVPRLLWHSISRRRLCSVATGHPQQN